MADGEQPLALLQLAQSMLLLEKSQRIAAGYAWPAAVCWL